MRTVVAILASLVLAATVAAQSPKDDRLIVHEWGTFTSVSGSDGVRLEFRPLVEEDLPHFVLDRATQSGFPNPRFTKGIRVFQRMETPVTYFYTDRERTVRVKVRFPKGLLTEFYPPVASMKPEFQEKVRAEIANSELDWGQITLIPQEHLATQVTTPEVNEAVQARLLAALLPAAYNANHYAYARETDSALVHVRRLDDPERPQLPMGDFFEKFLFYRGLGNFSLPLSVKAGGQGQFEVSNSGTEPIRSLFLVTVQGEKVWFSYADQVPGKGRLTMTQSLTPSSPGELSAAVAEALIAEKLYDKEARAMVKTWHDSWFQEEGTRLFYMLPEKDTDALLPLVIEPRPQELVRVMVGRLEIMTPEDESRINGLVKASAAKRASDAKRIAEARERGEEPAAEPLPESLLGMGRLAEPALVRVKYYSKDPAVRAEATQLLNELYAHWSAQSGG